MMTRQGVSPRPSAAAILAGIGLLERRELAAFIALLEAGGTVQLAKGAVKDVARRLRLMGDDGASGVLTLAAQLEMSGHCDDVLRHRLWVALSTALVIPTDITPYSTRSAKLSAAALAVRASERLSAALSVRSIPSSEPNTKPGLAEQAGREVASLLKKGRDLLRTPTALPFHELVERELLRLFADEDLVNAAMADADPDVAKSIRKGHVAAQAALAAGGSWIVFAQVVGATGFAPYILAAQASAWIPFVGGPALVSFLAVLVNPLTVFAGVGALAWLGGSRIERVVQSQIAARLCVLLAAQGTEKSEAGMWVFIGSMRRLAGITTTELTHLSVKEQKQQARRIGAIAEHLGDLPGHPAGCPPEPWDRHALRPGQNGYLVEASAISALTAGEMLWHAVAINPDVIKAADFSRAADLGDPIAFAAHAQEFLVRGADYSLRGYVAERLVLNRLVADGHHVQLASTSNAPGLDLIVDGAPVQVKAGTEVGILVEHFSKYPDIPVVANASLAEEVQRLGEPWAHLVATVPGFELSTVEADIAEALGHAISLVDPSVLDLALASGLLRGGYEVWRGAIPVSDLPAWLVIDGAARGTLGVVGGQAGAWIGLVAIGPAGALVLGPAAACAALFGTGKVKEHVEAAMMRPWHDQLRLLSDVLSGALREVLQRRVQLLRERRDWVSLIDGGSEDLSEWLHRRAEDDLLSAVEALVDFDVPSRSSNDPAVLLVDASRIAPGDKTVLAAVLQLELHLKARPKLNDTLREQVRARWPGSPRIRRETPTR
jgi:hypothetical protein